jgi:4-amino-4-deoxy-L-arabinose transferase-like glycosyltransferase
MTLLHQLPRAARPFLMVSKRAIRRWWAPAALAAILVLGLAARWERARFGLPYLQHVDEPYIANKALGMLQTGDFNPHLFFYGTLVTYLDVAVDVAHFYSLAGLPPDDPRALRSPHEIRIGKLFGPLTGPSEEYGYYLSHPSFYLWNRRLTGLFGIAAVLLAFALAKRLAGKEDDPGRGVTAGLAAAFALATNTFHLEQSSMVTADVPAATLAVTVLWLSLGFVDSQRPGWLCLALLAGGLAVSTKFNSAPILLVPVTVLVVAAVRRSAGYRPWLWPAAVAVPAAGFLAATPYAVLDLPAMLRDTGYVFSAYAAPSGEPLAAKVGRLTLSLSQLWEFLGWGVAIGALAGLALAARRWAAWLVFPIGILVLLATATARLTYHRNLVLLYPLAAIAFGVCVGELFAEGRWRRARLVAAAMLLLGAGWAAQRGLRVSWTAGHTPDTRSQVIDRLNAAGRWRRIAVARELQIHPLDLARLRARAVVKPLARLLCSKAPEEVLVLPARVGSTYPVTRPLTERYERVLALGGGPEVFVLEPLRSLPLDSPPMSPGIAVRLPAAPPAVLAGACLETLSPGSMERSAGARRNGTVALLPAGESLLTPALALAAGSKVFEIGIAGPDADRPTASALRVALLDAAGGDVVKSALLPVATAPGTLRFGVALAAPRTVRLRVTAEGPAASRLRIAAITLTEPATTEGPAGAARRRHSPKARRAGR